MYSIPNLVEPIWMKIYAPTAAATPVQKRVLYAASFILTSLVLRETYRSIINAMTSTILKITQCENVTNMFSRIFYMLKIIIFY